MRVPVQAVPIQDRHRDRYRYKNRRQEQEQSRVHRIQYIHVYTVVVSSRRSSRIQELCNTNSNT